MQKSIASVFLVILYVSSSSQAFAQDDYGLSKKVGDADFYPSVRLDYFTNDNVFLDGTLTESSGVEVSPKFLLIAETGQLSLEAEYQGKYKNSDVSAESSADHSLRFETKAEFSKRVRAGARFEFLTDHQDLGTRYTRGIADENTDQTEYSNVLLHLFGNYGANQAKGNLELGLDIESLSFTNQEALTEGDDYSTVEPYGIFSFRLSPDVRALTELRFGSANYDDNRQDRSDITALVGVSIAPTGKLDGEIKIGSIFSSYDNSELRDQTELTVVARLDYSPVDYSTFFIKVKRGIDQFNDSATGPAVLSDFLQLHWSHQWSERLLHRATLTRTSTSRECPEEDTIYNSANFELELRFRRWLAFGAGVDNVTRDAKLCEGEDNSALNQDRTRLGVHMRVTL